jgi:hypothetical protein
MTQPSKLKLVLKTKSKLVLVLKLRNKLELMLKLKSLGLRLNIFLPTHLLRSLPPSTKHYVLLTHRNG